MAVKKQDISKMNKEELEEELRLSNLKVMGLIERKKGLKYVIWKFKTGRMPPQAVGVKIINGEIIAPPIPKHIEAKYRLKETEEQIKEELKRKRELEAELYGDQKEKKDEEDTSLDDLIEEACRARDD